MGSQHCPCLRESFSLAFVFCFVSEVTAPHLVNMKNERDDVVGGQFQAALTVTNSDSLR